MTSHIFQAYISMIESSDRLIPGSQLKVRTLREVYGYGRFMSLAVCELEFLFIRSLLSHFSLPDSRTLEIFPEIQFKKQSVGIKQNILFLLFFFFFNWILH